MQRQKKIADEIIVDNDNEGEGIDQHTETYVIKQKRQIPMHRSFCAHSVRWQPTKDTNNKNIILDL